MRKHSGEMPFSCSHCPKRFRSMRNLENHSRIHTGEKPFKCRTCGRRFTTSSGLCQHFKKSSGCRRNLEDTTGSYTANLEENSDTQIRTCIILVSGEDSNIEFTLKTSYSYPIRVGRFKKKLV